MRIFHALSRIMVALALGLALSLALSGYTSPEKPQSSKTGQGGVTPAPGVGAVATTSPQASATPAQVSSREALNLVVLDPAHGGTDLGARGTEGIRESEVVLEFTAQVKRSLEEQGFQVLLTREGNENPSFDDRSARVNAQRGAIFITLHIASMGLPGTVRTYVLPDAPPSSDATGLIPWDQAQAPFVGLSHKLGDMVQAEFAQRFKGSPSAAQVAPVRQLRTVAAPAIAVEISSVSAEQRADLDHMVPGVADAIAHGVAAFRPSYVLPALPGPFHAPGVQR